MSRSIDEPQDQQIYCGISFLCLWTTLFSQAWKHTAIPIQIESAPITQEYKASDGELASKLTVTWKNEYKGVVSMFLHFVSWLKLKCHRVCAFWMLEMWERLPGDFNL
jgi:hypothetical protein